MDDRLERALEFANYSATLNAQKKAVRNRVKQIQTVFYAGGTFLADQQTIAFVSTLLEQVGEEFILIDIRETPIEIAKGKELLEKLTSAYVSATNEMLAEFSKFKKARNINKLLEG